MEFLWSLEIGDWTLSPLTMPDLVALQDQLGYQFRDENLLRLALTHPSSTHDSNLDEAGEIRSRLPDNQRLEFLGDSVLGLILSHELHEKFPDASEGS
ncbi:MAG TPA: ribonuclease III domain-containing protein, partial [Verrucomicrobiae bacterium]